MSTSNSLGFDDLACFVAVADQGGFTAAAAKLRMQKATVSRHVQQLEAKLGSQLLVRTTRAVRLTDEGLLYLTHARAAVDMAMHAAQALHDSKTLPTGSLRLTTVPYFGDVILGPLLIDYLRKFPAVSLQLDLRSQAVDLISDGFDVAIRFGMLQDSGLVCRKIGEARIVCVASPRYLAMRGTPQSPADLSDHDVIAMGPGDNPAKWQFSNQERRVNVTLAPRLRSTSHLLHLQAVTAGLGVARLPEPIVRTALESGQLTTVLNDWAGSNIPITLLMPKRKPLPARTRTFVDHIGAAVSSGEFARLMLGVEQPRSKGRRRVDAKADATPG